jgi:hypothetical protein
LEGNKMIRTTAKQRLTNSLKTVLAAAVLALPAISAHAQFGYSLGQRLGGPLVIADNSGYGNYGGYSGYGGYTGNGYNGYTGANANYGYNLPRPIIFSGNGVDSTFGSQLSTNVNTNNSFGIVNTSGANQLINDPLSGFQQPRTVIDPFTGLAIQQGFNSASNQFVNGQYTNAFNQSAFNSNISSNNLSYLNQLYLNAQNTNTLNTSAVNTATQPRRIIYTAVPAQSMGVTIMNPTIPVTTYGLQRPSGFAGTTTTVNNTTGLNSANPFLDMTVPRFGSTATRFGSTGTVNVHTTGLNSPNPFLDGSTVRSGAGFRIQSSIRSMRAR